MGGMSRAQRETLYPLKKESRLSAAVYYIWSGCWDLNPEPLAPKASALAN
jgi:hypothetical protein